VTEAILEEPFGRVVVPEAKERLRAFELATRDAFNQLMDELSENPDQWPQRVRPISRDGRTLLYTHPRPPLEITYEIDPPRQRAYFLHFAAPQVETGKPLFISYSHQDQQWLDTVRKWLVALEQNGLVRIWSDNEIAPGQDWRHEIEEALTEARAALLLVTQNFLASTYIQTQELPRLLEAARSKGVAILWIAIGECLYEESAIERYQALNDPRRPLATLSAAQQDAVLKEIHGKMKRALQPA